MWIPDLSGFNGPKYIRIADALCCDIRSGELKPGTKLPPQRELADLLKVNFGTVTKAYELTKERGLVRGEVGRGTFVRKDPPSHKTPWPKENGIRNHVDMRSDFPCDMSDDPVFKHAFIHLSEHKNFPQLLQYQPGSSLPNHQVIAGQWIKSLGFTVAPANILITSGALHGCFLALMAITKPGDVVLTENTTSPAIRSVASMLHIKLKGVNMDDEGMIPDELEEKMQSSQAQVVYSVSDFHNPTACMTSSKRRQEIATIIEKHHALLIEDGVFSPLVNHHQSPVSELIPDHAFYTTSFSKCIAPGFRVGYLCVPEKYYSKVLAGLRVTTWMASPLMVQIISDWIKDGNARRLASLQTNKINERVGIARRIFKDFIIQSQDSCPHIWLKLPEVWRESPAVSALHKKNIDVTPGEYFSVNTGYLPGALRLCLGQLSDFDTLQKACLTIRETLAKTPDMDILSLPY